MALDPQGPGTQVSWDNPATTRKGTFTPTGAPFVKNDEICRDFSAHLSGPLRIRPPGHGLPPLRRRVGDQGRQAGEGATAKSLAACRISRLRTGVANGQHFSHMNVWAEAA